MSWIQKKANLERVHRIQSKDALVKECHAANICMNDLEVESCSAMDIRKKLILYFSQQNRQPLPSNRYMGYPLDGDENLSLNENNFEQVLIITSSR
jgi:hypothetical protein